jgi:hypothetical protein
MAAQSAVILFQRKLAVCPLSDSAAPAAEYRPRRIAEKNRRRRNRWEPVLLPTRLKLGQSMGGIEQSVRLYNQAYQLAWDHIEKDETLRRAPNVSQRLRDAVRYELQTGASDIVAIAAAAVRYIQRP